MRSLKIVTFIKWFCCREPSQFCFEPCIKTTQNLLTLNALWHQVLYFRVLNLCEQYLPDGDAILLAESPPDKMLHLFATDKYSIQGFLISPHQAYTKVQRTARFFHKN
jgi:hypothetical protein